MSTDEKLLSYNQRGLIPGPNETNEQYYQRVDFCEKFFLDPASFFSDCSFSLKDRVVRQDLDWVYAKLLKTYDIAPDYLVAFYSDKDLYFFQGACTWVFDYKKHSLAVVQLRKKLKKKKYFFYDREEILTHEMAHLARMAFDEKSEEMFAYLLSSSVFRRAFGALVHDEKEVIFFFILFFVSIFSFVFSSYFSFLTSVFNIFSFATFGYLSLGLYRLFKQKRVLKKAAHKLLKVVKFQRSVRAVLFRMSDKEILQFTKMSPQQIVEFVHKQKTQSLRWRMIFLAYFSKVENKIN